MSGGYHSLKYMRLLLRPILIGLTCAVLFVVFFYAEEDWRGWHAWEQFKRNWTAKGEKFGSQSFVPAPVPADQNFALTPIVVSCYGRMIDKAGHEIRPRNTNLVNRLQISCRREADTGNQPEIGSRQKRTFTDLGVWQQYYRHPADTNSWKSQADEFPTTAQPQSPAADVLLALSKYDSVIEELRSAGRLPYSRFPLQYDNEDPAEILLPHLAALKRCSQVLQLRAIAELQNGQSDRALDDVSLMFRLTESIHNEPFLISHLVRIAILQIALQPVWEGLGRHQWSDAQLADLNQELSRLDFLADYKLSMHGEMMFQDGILRFIRRHPEKFTNLSGPVNESNPNFFLTLFLTLAPSGWYYQNELRCARVMEQSYLPAADVQNQTVDPALIRQADAMIDDERQHPGPFNLLENMMLPALSAAARKFAFAQNSVELAQVACALERYRMARGQYPESLHALKPQFVAKLPNDVIGGAPLIYRPRTNGDFQLYSVGWNETDDGGVAGFKKDGSADIASGDWIW